MGINTQKYFREITKPGKLESSTCNTVHAKVLVCCSQFPGCPYSQVESSLVTAKRDVFWQDVNLLGAILSSNLTIKKYINWNSLGSFKRTWSTVFNFNLKMQFQLIFNRDCSKFDSKSKAFRLSSVFGPIEFTYTSMIGITFDDHHPLGTC